MANKKPKKNLHVIERRTPADVDEALNELIDQRDRGDLTGLAYVAMAPRKLYEVNVVGEARENPTYARGAVGSLLDLCRKLILGRSKNDNDDDEC